MARPKPERVLSDDERQTLTRWAARPKSTQRLALRARIVLACVDETSNKVVAARLGVCGATVGTWRNRFVARRLEGRTDEPRPGAPRTVADGAVEQVVTKTLETKPTNATHWSTRGMARASGLSQSTAGRIWRAFGLKQHRADAFKLSTDPFFVEKVRDVGVYLSSPENTLVLCVDEKPKCRPSSAPNRCCRWSRPEPSEGPTTTPGTAPPRYSRPSTWRPVPWWASATGGTGVRSSSRSSIM